MSFPRRSELSDADRARLTVHQVAAATTSDDAEIPDFDVYCVAVGVVADHLERTADREAEHGR